MGTTQSQTAVRNKKEPTTLLRQATSEEPQHKLFSFEEAPLPVRRTASPDLLDIKFDLLDHGTHRLRGWALEAAANSKGNIGSFYTSLYKGLFYNGYSIEETAHQLHLQAEERSFRPDLSIKGLFGADFIEIKSRHTGGSKQGCRKAQAENYTFELLHRISDKKDLRPSVNYAFFMYGGSKPLKLYRDAPEEAMAKLAQSTKELLIVPLNMAYMIFKMSKTEKRGEDYEYEYWRVSGHLLRKLHEGTLKVPGEIIDYHSERHKINVKKVKEFAQNPNLCLDQIVVRKQSSDEIKQLRHGDTLIEPFKVTTYSLTNPEKWNKSFAKHHSTILGGLGIRDTYTEWKLSTVPF